MLPLSGLRVLDLSNVIAGPYASSLLQQLGADVFKIEPPDGDAVRKWQSPRGPLPFVQMNAGKRSIVIDMHAAEGIELIRRMVPSFDLLLHNSRPGRMERLGLSGPECLELNPRLVYVSISGFGGVGPLGSRPAYDSIGQAFGGLLGLLTGTDGRPTIGPTFGDLVTGLVAASGALAGLLERERTGAGLVVETSLVEGVVALIADTFAHQQATGQQLDYEARGRRSQVFTLPTADGSYLVAHLSTSERFFRNIVEVAGRPELGDDPRFDTFDKRVEHFAELQAELEAAFLTRPRAEWEELLSAGDVPHTSVLELGEVLDHPQYDALRLFAGQDERTGLRLVDVPWRFNGVRPGGDRLGPYLGEHTLSAMKEFLTDEELADLIAKGVLRTPPELQT